LKEETVEVNVSKVKCDNCGKEVSIIDGYTYFGVLCFKCSQNNNAMSKEIIKDMIND